MPVLFDFVVIEDVYPCQWHSNYNPHENFKKCLESFLLLAKDFRTGGRSEGSLNIGH